MTHTNNAVVLRVVTIPVIYKFALTNAEFIAATDIAQTTLTYSSKYDNLTFNVKKSACVFIINLPNTLILP